MADMGMPEFVRPARSLDADDLIAQFEELEQHAPQLRHNLCSNETSSGGANSMAIQRPVIAPVVTRLQQNEAIVTSRRPHAGTHR